MAFSSSEAGLDAAASEPRPIVFLLHGIFGTSARWTLGPPDKALAYVLADQGFDVWMINTRGNTYSRNHTRLNPDTDQAFWNFDLETVSIGDLTAVFDYVYNITQETTSGGPYFFICHSMGCAEIAILLSEYEEYNDLFDAVFMMAPPIFMTNSKISFWSGLADIMENFVGYKEIRRARKQRRWLATCKSWFCHSMASRMLSVSYDQLNMTMLPVILDHVSQGSSSKVVYHFAQLVKGGHIFRKYDYGTEKNQKHYNGSSKPPNFNISNITTPIYIFYGDGDRLIAKDDVMELSKAMPSIVNLYEVEYPGWNHNDFVYAIEARHYVYDKMIQHMKDIIVTYDTVETFN